MVFKCKTVGELIKALQHFDQDARLGVDGPDCGGYDVTLQPVALVSSVEEGYLPEHADYKFLKERNTVLINGVGLELAGVRYPMDLWDIRREGLKV
jgi:hypothetical protein